MKLWFLGTCAGTEPIEGAHHTSWAIEADDGSLYFFDAGENCSYTAHLAGVNILGMRACFISHTHMDHIGGLANLFWVYRKLLLKDGKKRAIYDPITLKIPNLKSYEGIKLILQNTEGGFTGAFGIAASQVYDGEIYDDGSLKVIACHNSHLSHREGDDWRSFSYRIESEEKVIVFSGDIGNAADMKPLLGGRIDMLLIETGHRTVDEACSEVASLGADIKRLFFIHNGRWVLSDIDAARRTSEREFHGESHICLDGESYTL